MNHPPKKKAKNPLFPENQPIDERHLIDLEDAAAHSLEDRIRIYWMEHNGLLSGCLVVLLLLVVAYQGMRLLKEHREHTLQTEYAAADTDKALAAFATTHSDKELGGFAALSTADAAYEDGDYPHALEWYTLATAALKQPVLAGRARLGQAFALYQAGDTEQGLAKLRALNADTSLAAAARAEAAYHLAIEADTAGRSTEFDSLATQIKDSPMAGQWQQRLSDYQQQTK